MKKLTTRQIALNGVVAGLYAAITILTASFAYGNIQFRIADSLCVLVVLEPSLTVGLTLGCLISNIFRPSPRSISSSVQPGRCSAACLPQE